MFFKDVSRHPRHPPTHFDKTHPWRSRLPPNEMSSPGKGRLIDSDSTDARHPNATDVVLVYMSNVLRNGTHFGYVSRASHAWFSALGAFLVENILCFYMI